MNRKSTPIQRQAAEITRSASKQTFFTIKFFADQDLVGDAYCAYAYFRWVDDVLDGPTGSQLEKRAFLQRQMALLYGEQADAIAPCPEEEMLLALVQTRPERSSGLWSYLENMMAVMEFDLERRGQPVSQAELDGYSHKLAVSVMDGLMYFIGHDQSAPNEPGKYDAVIGAHITHMLRDTSEDIEVGYFNIPNETLQQRHLSASDWNNLSYRTWVCRRVKLARAYFNSGREYIARIKPFRRRLAGFAYAARFEWVLKTIERDSYCLRADYSQRKSIRAALTMVWSVLVSFLGNEDAHRGANHSQLETFG